MNSLLARIRKQPASVSNARKAIAPFLQINAFHAFRYASTSLKTLPLPISTRTGFQGRIQDAWAETFANLSKWESFRDKLALPKQERVLIAGWHFPEVPRIFPAVQKAHILLLVSQDAPWLEKLKAAGCTVNFKAKGGQRNLVAQMAKGRVVGAMLDHVYADTQTVQAPLFGRPAKTPSGIFDLCIANKYTIVFIAPRKGRVQIVDSVAAPGHSAASLAARFNQWLEREVKRDPGRWLMWTSLPYRFEVQKSKAKA